MSNVDNILGVAKFALGAPGNGIMGTTLTEFPDVEVGSVQIEGSTPNETTIPTEADDAYITLNDTASPTTIKARLYGVTAAQMVLIAGGTATGDDWKAPNVIPNIYLSCLLEGQAIGGKVSFLEIPYGKISARIQGTITKNGLPAVDVTVTANTPVSDTGVKGAPLVRGKKDAA